MRRITLITSIVNGISSIGPQLMALLLLSSTDFGSFSVAYLMFALAVSVIYSVLCDAWAIVQRHQTDGSHIFSTILFVLCLFFAFLGGVVTLIALEDPALSAASAVCIMLAAYRSGARYFRVHSGMWNKVMHGDWASIGGLITGGALAFALDFAAIYTVFAAWGVSSLCGLSFGPYPAGAIRHSKNWLVQNRLTIRPLISDSLALDATSIGTPFVLLPVLGVQGFGLYRGISNLAAPVRLLISPVRPIIMASPQRIIRARRPAIFIFVAFLCGISMWVSVAFLGHTGIQLGVLSELSPFAGAVGLYVFSSALLNIFPLVVRAQRRSFALLAGRITQIVFGLFAPLIGFALFGLEGAIWAFAIGSIVSALVWVLIACNHRINNVIAG